MCLIFYTTLLTYCSLVAQEVPINPGEEIHCNVKLLVSPAYIFYIISTLHLEDHWYKCEIIYANSGLHYLCCPKRSIHFETVCELSSYWTGHVQNNWQFKVSLSKSNWLISLNIKYNVINPTGSANTIYKIPKLS